MKDLKANTISGYVIDLPMLQYYKNEFDTDCKTRIISDLVNTFDYGVAFNKNLSDSIILDFNLHLITTMGTSITTRLNDQYLTSQMGACIVSTSVGSGNLGFWEVSGLWIILGCSIGQGVLFACWGVWKHHFKKNETLSTEKSFRSTSFHAEKSKSFIDKVFVNTDKPAERSPSFYRPSSMHNSSIISHEIHENEEISIGMPNNILQKVVGSVRVLPENPGWITISEIK
jgi:hypothetical protein